MADIEINPTSLVVHIRGLDRLLAFKSQLEVPLEHIASVEAVVPEAHKIWKGFRIVGTDLPGVVAAGQFWQHGEWSFWDVHDPDKAIAIYLRDEKYAKLVIGVEDPPGTAQAITNAIRQLP
jgi:hypothetical protein